MAISIKLKLFWFEQDIMLAALFCHDRMANTTQSRVNKKIANQLFVAKRKTGLFKTMQYKISLLLF